MAIHIQEVISRLKKNNFHYINMDNYILLLDYPRDEHNMYLLRSTHIHYDGWEFIRQSNGSIEIRETTYCNCCINFQPKMVWHMWASRSESEKKKDFVYHKETICIHPGSDIERRVFDYERNTTWIVKGNNGQCPFYNQKPPFEKPNEDNREEYYKYKKKLKKYKLTIKS